MLEGKRYNKACKGATNPNEAKQFAYDYKSNVYKGREGYVKKQVIKLENLIKKFLSYSEANKRSFSNDRYYCQYFLAFMGNKYIDEIKPYDIEDYKCKRQKRVKNSTVNRELNSISKMFSLAVEYGWLEYNPCFKVKKLRVENIRERVLSKDEENSFLNQCVEDRAYLKPIILMALHTGIRKSNILQLEWSCVNFTQKFITVLNPKNGKTNKIPMTGTLKAMLEQLPRTSKYVFPNPLTNKPYVDIRKTFNNVLKLAGIEDLTFHAFRHTAATRMVEKGTDLVTVKDLLGHSEIKTTMRYAHPVPDRKLQAIQALDNY